MSPPTPPLNQSLFPFRVDEYMKSERNLSYLWDNMVESRYIFVNIIYPTSLLKAPVGRLEILLPKSKPLYIVYKYKPIMLHKTMLWNIDLGRGVRRTKQYFYLNWVPFLFFFFLSDWRLCARSESNLYIIPWWNGVIGWYAMKWWQGDDRHH